MDRSKRKESANFSINRHIAPHIPRLNCCEQAIALKIQVTLLPRLTIWRQNGSPSVSLRASRAVLLH